MKTPIIRASFLASVLLALGAASSSANAQVITTNNIFSSTTAASATGLAQYQALAATDGTTTGFQFQTSDTALATESLTLSGFSAPNGIDTIKVFTGFPYYTRFAQSVSIYTTNALTTDFSSIDLTQYDVTTVALNLALPTTTTPTSGLDGHYLTDSGSLDPVYGTSFGNDIYYDTLTGLNIAAGTQSILFVFNKGTNPVNDTPQQYDSVISEIQGFAAVPAEAPEPSTWAMMLGGLAILGFVVRRRLNF